MKCRKCGSYTDKRFCPDCGTDLLQRRRKKPKQSKAVSTTKLVLGIVSIVLFIFSMLQSCAVTSLGALVSEETVASGLIGILLSFSLLIAGIVGISTREKPIGSLITAVIWIIGSFIGFAGSTQYGDLSIWSFFALMFGIAYFITTFLSFNKKNFYKKWWFYVISLLIVFSLLSMLTRGMRGTEQTNERNYSVESENEISGVVESNKENSAAPQPVHTPSGTMREKEKTPGVFGQGDFKVTYISHSIVKNYSGEDCLNVVFEFVNYGDEPTSFDVVAYCKAFQDGIQLETDYYDNKDCVEWGTEVKADTPIRVDKTFMLRNATSPVELVIERFFSLSDEKTEITLELK